MIHPGEHEDLKAATHAAVLALAAVCGIYNLCAFVGRRDPECAWNALLYGLLVGVEYSKVRHHLESERRS